MMCSYVCVFVCVCVPKAVRNPAANISHIGPGGVWVCVGGGKVGCKRQRERERERERESLTVSCLSISLASKDTYMYHPEMWIIQVDPRCVWILLCPCLC
jgi:hypothetical protein